VGKVTIHCPSTGWIVELNYDLNKDLVKIVDGTLMNLERNKLAKDEVNTYYISGKCGGKIYISKTEFNSNHEEPSANNQSYMGSIFKMVSSVIAAPETEKIPEGDVFVDLAKEPVHIPTYPNEDLLDPNLSSIVIWKELSQWIRVSDFEKSDEVKQKIEHRQRMKRQQLEEVNEVFHPNYFVKDKKDVWQIKPEYAGNLGALFPVPHS